MDAADRAFVRDMESARFPLAEFDHAAHLRLAYCYAREQDLATAGDRMRATLQHYLKAHGVESGKYHETLTRAWMTVVRVAIDSGSETFDSADFLAAHPELFERDCLLAHYSEQTLMSDEARRRFVEPDRRPFDLKRG